MSNKEKIDNPPKMRGPGGRGPGGMEKPKDFKSSMKKLFSYSKKYNVIMVFAIVLSVASSIFTLMGPDKLSEITDYIMAGMQSNIDLDAVTDIAIFLVSIYGLSLLFSYVQANIMATVSQKICHKLRTDLMLKINKLPLSYFDTRSYGDTLSCITNDVDTIGNSLNQSMASVFSGLCTFFGALILMFSTNVIMAITALLATMLGFMIMGVIMKSSQKFFMAQQNELGKLNGIIEEVYTGHTVVKAYNSEEYAIDNFNKNNENLYNASWKAQFISGLMMPIMGFVGNFAYVAICIVGAVLTMNGSISFSVIVAFMVYIRLFTQPLSTIAQAVPTLQSAAAASERVFGLLEEVELSNELNKTPFKKSVVGKVEFKDIKFGYTPEKLILKGFSADIKAGQKVAIVGPTGAGKTTLVNLLMRFYELNSGEILIDDTPISQMSREDLHDIFAMVLQDTWMFEGSIRDNIAYNQTKVTDEDIINACKSVGIHHTINTLANGYDTIMTDSSLSVGEKQLLTIARAMVKKSDLLILDEATSSVDTRTEILIQNALDKLSNGKTSFIIAHRLSTIKNADLILVMKEGNIIESGNHEKLLSEKGFYADLYNSQFDESNVG